MKKNRERDRHNPDHDTMRSEYDFTHAVRGATAARYAQGTNVVVIDPEVIDVFPDASTVNATLVLIGHLDTVPASPEGWTHPPFSAVEADGCIWGRGALDMKHMAAMSITVLALLKRAGFAPTRDVLACFTADEEVGGAYGAGWMVDHQPDLIRAEDLR